VCVRYAWIWVVGAVAVSVVECAVGGGVVVVIGAAEFQEWVSLYSMMKGLLELR
jgi:hypothetical protein